MNIHICIQDVVYMGITYFEKDNHYDISELHNKNTIIELFKYGPFDYVSDYFIPLSRHRAQKIQAILKD